MTNAVDLLKACVNLRGNSDWKTFRDWLEGARLDLLDKVTKLEDITVLRRLQGQVMFIDNLIKTIDGCKEKLQEYDKNVKVSKT